ncbi:serine/arginine repetitive matrix protein 2 [Xylanimonas ulmi]|uniref:Uncharacterized protein n=1 Tax=Xylanimonas ulmi TaxID=228973 RepID=A0A4Q7M2I7_9MICO|nr:serine/arginine repetitive matrix protein 2 [Xylanibacterium ulmi]RZS60668.1 hypothetical protein EV386_0940 [Xylanibacterium ulmi]
MNTSPAYESPEGLRRLLLRLHRAGGDVWRHDAEAADLLLFTIKKYGALARTHHLDAEDVAPIALENLRTRSVREALDPWGALTRAVQRAIIAEERGRGLLCSPDRARKRDVSSHHDAYRFGERERLADDLPALTTSVDFDDAARTAKGLVDRGVQVLVEVFRVCDWARDVAETGIELVVGRLADSTSRGTAYEYLRRDPTTRSQLDISQRSWLAMLRCLLGSQNPEKANTWAGRGALHAVLAGMSARDLLLIDDVVRPLVAGAPTEGEHSD